MRFLLNKRFVVASVLAISTVAVAALTIGEVNKKIATQIAPFNDQFSQVDFKFTGLKIDAIRTIDLAMVANVWAQSKDKSNQASAKINHIDYHYGNGTAPTLTIDGEINFDLVKAFGQDSLNETGVELPKFIDQLVRDYGAEFGPALSVTKKKIDLKNDAQNNLVQLVAELIVKINPAKLPASYDIKRLYFTAANLSVTVSQKNARFSAKVAMNPKHSSFSSDDVGMKEYIEALQNEDAKTYSEIVDLVKQLKSGLEFILEMDASKSKTP